MSYPDCGQPNPEDDFVGLAIIAACMWVLILALITR